MKLKAFSFNLFVKGKTVYLMMFGIKAPNKNRLKQAKWIKKLIKMSVLIRKNI